MLWRAMRELGRGTVLFLAGVEQTEVHLGLRLQRKNQKLESGWKERKSLFAHCIHYFSWWRHAAQGSPSSLLFHSFPIRSAQFADPVSRTIPETPQMKYPFGVPRICSTFLAASANNRTFCASTIRAYSSTLAAVPVAFGPGRLDVGRIVSIQLVGLGFVGGLLQVFLGGSDRRVAAKQRLPARHLIP